MNQPTICVKCQHHGLTKEIGYPAIDVCLKSPKDGGMNFVTGKYVEPTIHELCCVVNTNGKCVLYDPATPEEEVF